MTTTPNFRALCAELVTAFKDESTYTQRVEILDRARAARRPKPPSETDLALAALKSKKHDQFLR